MHDASEATDPPALIEKAKALGIDLPETAAEEVLAYLDAMLVTNQQINLTAVRDREQAVVLHALDGLAFQLTGLRPHHVLDLGTGNGFPGVAVAALHPHATTVLLDKTGKKVRAIGTCLLTSGIDRIETIQLDAAQAPALRKDFRHAFDLCTARAVARPEQVAALAEPLVRPGGHLVLWLEAEADIPPKLGRFHHHKTIPYDLPPPAPRHRQLAIWHRK
ncbi:MAG: class I SAM-dependent methyltransferase [Planctomycetes bacterium]|nr:class I SAM-dependent methyltransferase [Planctomycetota bacterium]